MLHRVWLWSQHLDARSARFRLAVDRVSDLNVERSFFDAFDALSHIGQHVSQRELRVDRHIFFADPFAALCERQFHSFERLRSEDKVYRICFIHDSVSIYFVEGLLDVQQSVVCHFFDFFDALRGAFGWVYCRGIGEIDVSRSG